MNRYTRTENKAKKISIVLLTALLLTGTIASFLLFLHKPKAVAEDENPSAEPPITVESSPEQIQSSQAPSFVPSVEVPLSKEVDNAYFDTAAFIGDSRTEGLMLNAHLENATFYAAKGLMVDTFFTKKFVKIETGKITIPQALQQKHFKKVYIMLGVNELGWVYESIFIKKYGELIDEVKRLQPDAAIYIQSILPVTQKKSESDKVYNNTRIQRYNQLIKELATEKEVYYLRVEECVGTDNGALPQDASPDGVHLNRAYCERWLQYLKTHTLPQPE